MEIRKICPRDDLFAVSRVYEESWKSAYSGLLPQEYLARISKGQWIPSLQEPERETLLLLDGCSIVGVAGCCPSRTPALADWGEIASIYLLPAYWGTGWGRQLFAAAVAALEGRGYCNLFLWVLEENRRARAFYKKMGFCPHPSRRELVIGGAVAGEIQYRREKKGNLPPKSGGLPIPSETGW